MNDFFDFERESIHTDYECSLVAEEGGPATRKQIGYIKGLLKKNYLDEAYVANLIDERLLNFDKPLQELTKKEAQTVIDNLLNI